MTITGALFKNLKVAAECVRMHGCMYVCLCVCLWLRIRVRMDAFRYMFTSFQLCKCETDVTITSNQSSTGHPLRRERCMDLEQLFHFRLTLLITAFVRSLIRP